MKITASRKDDILKRKAQYEADLKAYNEREAQSRAALLDAENKILEPIKSYLGRKLSRYNALTFEINVDRAYHGFKDKGVRVWIRCNEHNKFDDDVALSWSYNVDLDSDGNVFRETSSWSGLSATTEAQMRSLHQTISALDFLNDVDWDELVNVDMPAYEDFYDNNNKRPAKEDFDAELQEAELGELIGSNKIIKCKNWGESCPYRGDVWLHLIKETPSMYTANIIPDYVFVLGGQENEVGKYIDGTYGEYRIRKSSVHPYIPFEVKEV